MIRFGKYHFLAALGLVLAYNGIQGMLAAFQPAPAIPPETANLSVPAAELQLPAVTDTLPTLIVPTAEPTTLPPATHQADTSQLPAPVTATPASQAGDSSPAIPIRATPSPLALAEEPTRLVIPVIDLDAPIVPAKMRTIKFRGEKVQQWLAPTYRAAGWHTDSARLGAIGNTVLNGHHNTLGAVFGHLVDLEIGDTIQVYSPNYLFIYQVTNRMIVPEKYQLMDTRMANLQWILPSQDERLTLITCWPDESNTHRVIIVAAPVERLQIGSDPQ